MKIIEKKNYNDIFPMRVECKQVKDSTGFTYGKSIDYCGSILEIDVEDIVQREYTKFYEKGIDYGVVCPICDSFILVDEKLLPTSVKLKAKEFKNE